MLNYKYALKIEMSLINAYYKWHFSLQRNMNICCISDTTKYLLNISPFLADSGWGFTSRICINKNVECLLWDVSMWNYSQFLRFILSVHLVVMSVLKSAGETEIYSSIRFVKLPVVYPWKKGSELGRNRT